jgi:hypothetical protein
MASNNSNYNKISVKTDSMVKMIEQLSKLGVFKEKRKKRAKRTAAPEDIRQDGDMGPGYVKTLEGQPGRGDPNLFALRQIQPGMTQQQIADITERNAAGVAALRAEVQQQRLEDFQGAFEPLTRLANIASERFRGAQEPGAGQRPNPFVQSTTIEQLPDIQEGEEAFAQTLNEGGPRATPAIQTEFFAEGEEEEARLGPQERLQIGGGGMSSAAAEMLGMPESFIAKTKKTTKKKLVRDTQDAADALGLGKIPTMRNSSDAIEQYYIKLTDLYGERDADANSKQKILADIDRILKDYFEQ